MLDEAQREIIVHSSLYALVAAAAWTFARGASPHRTIAALFAWELVADLGRIALSPVLDAAPFPYTGGMLALYYADHALHLSFRFALVAACLRVFERASIMPALYAFAATTAGVVIFKQATGLSLVPVHHVIAAVTTLACWVLVIRAVFAPPSRLQVPSGAHVALVLVVTLMLVKVALHYFGPLDDTWSDVRMADTFVHGLIAAGYLGGLLRNGVRRWRTSSS